jgi:hypothetical protein
MSRSRAVEIRRAGADDAGDVAGLLCDFNAEYDEPVMEAAMDAARAEGAGTMELGTGEADVVARALYESLGFDNHEHGPGGVSTVSLFYEREL